MAVILFAGNKHRKVDVRSIVLNRTEGSTFELTARTTGGAELKIMKDTSGKLDRIMITVGDDGSTRVIAEGRAIK